MDGVKTLDVQHPGTRRRMEGGTVVQLIIEQERIRLGTGVVAAGCRAAVLGSGEAYKR